MNCEIFAWSFNLCYISSKKTKHTKDWDLNLFLTVKRIEFGDQPKLYTTYLCRAEVIEWVRSLRYPLIVQVWRAEQKCARGIEKWNHEVGRGKLLLESWGTTFIPDWQPPLIFVWLRSHPKTTLTRPGR